MVDDKDSPVVVNNQGDEQEPEASGKDGCEMVNSSEKKDSDGKRRATSADPDPDPEPEQLSTAESNKSCLLDQDAIEALERAIQSSPARNMKKLTMESSSLTPKPVRRTLFPISSSNNSSPSQPSGEQRQEEHKELICEREEEDKENHHPEFEFINLPTTPTPPKKQSPIRFGNGSPRLLETATGQPDLMATPMRRKQQRTTTTPRSTGLRSPDHIDNIFLDMFPDTNGGDFSWADWFQTSPIARQRHDGDDDIIRAIMSDPVVHQRDGDIL